MKAKALKIAILAAVVALTVGIHYGYVFEPIFGHSHWIHAIHGRFCYIPIVIGSAWFGLRGGLFTALVVSVLVAPYIFLNGLEAHEFAGESVEIVFYFAIAILSGALLDRENAARKKREEMRVQLERSQKLSLVGQMAAGVAHEIKNPLASIKGAVEIVCEEDAPTEEKRKFGEIIQREIKRIDNAVRDFLNFARPRAPRLETLDLAESVRETAKQVEGQVNKARLALALSADSPVCIKGDREKIHQLTLNLLLNAVDASQPESEIEVRVEKDGASNARMVVRDCGEGISPEQLERIFEPFYTTKANGTGLGMTIVKSIVDEHNGKITITSHQDSGTTVNVRFPALKG